MKVSDRQKFYFWHQMLNKLGICCFTIYLVLFLNLGSSLHRAHFLGHSSADQSLDSAVCSCCSIGSFSDLESGPKARADHDCNICKFFQSFHVAFGGTLEVENIQKSFHFFSLPSPLIAAIVTPNFARGPPSFIG